MSKHEYNKPSYSNLDYQAYVKMAKMTSNYRDRVSSKNSSSKNQTNHVPFVQDRKPQFYRYDQLKERYNKLEDDYYEMMEKAQQRKKEHEALKTEIGVYQRCNQKDSSEIQRLTYLIDLHKKNTRKKEQQQIDMDFIDRVSKVNKFDQSTQDQIKLKSSAEMFRSRKRQQSIKKPPLSSSLPKKQQKSASKTKRGMQSFNQEKQKSNRNQVKLNHLINFQKQGYQQTKISKKMNNPSYSRLRFIPHNQGK